jgi:hypothetical protein
MDGHSDITKEYLSALVPHESPISRRNAVVSAATKRVDWSAWDRSISDEFEPTKRRLFAVREDRASASAISSSEASVERRFVVATRSNKYSHAWQ